jgi:hypothetical protein
VQGYGAAVDPGDVLSCCLPVEAGSRYCLGHTEILHGRPWPPLGA